MINEGQFETAAKTAIINTKIQKELRTMGLGLMVEIQYIPMIRKMLLLLLGRYYQTKR